VTHNSADHRPAKCRSDLLCEVVSGLIRVYWPKRIVYIDERLYRHAIDATHLLITALYSAPIVLRHFYTSWVFSLNYLIILQWCSREHLVSESNKFDKTEQNVRKIQYSQSEHVMRDKNTIKCFKKLTTILCIDTCRFFLFLIFLRATACNASRVLAIVLASVCLSVCPSHSAAISKRCKLGSWNLHCGLRTCRENSSLLRQNFVRLGEGVSLERRHERGVPSKMCLFYRYWLV